MNQDTHSLLVAQFEAWAGEPLESMTTLPPSGSYREYYRMKSAHRSTLGVYNTDAKENRAFIDFTRRFREQGLPVPDVYAADEDNCIYLIEDLGSETLFDHLQRNNGFNDEVIDFYKKVIRALIGFQLQGADCIDYHTCYPRQAFDRQSMLWDLHYFKYYFLKLARIPFDEQLLEDDYNTFINYLLEADGHYFMYRDFQSRNIMVKDGEPWFIDYQGGRRGALQYDIASLLYDAKAAMPETLRDELFDFYMDELSRHIPVNRTTFKAHYQAFVLIRIMQAMGAYGFRGFYEKKAHFLQSIPHALKNLAHLLRVVQLPVPLPTLLNTLSLVAESETLNGIARESSLLNVAICSFSYKRGIPVDISGNGGGFVFDCRALHNPGKYDQYKPLTGKDAEVITFLEQEDEVAEFLSHAKALVSQSVNRYTQRGFKNLMVNFGCTGGQHRSVYCAEQLAKHLQGNPDVKVTLRHLEQEMKAPVK
ncbi:MAG: phosphotransferase [Marinilabiliaceae bacterium]|nr:phosphotransferase [Marinilabiliaceae bacterium]